MELRGSSGYLMHIGSRRIRGAPYRWYPMHKKVCKMNGEREVPRVPAPCNPQCIILALCAPDQIANRCPSNAHLRRKGLQVQISFTALH